MNDLQIQYFLAVADNLSFTKTAMEKYVSQPAVSKQIAAMEEELGVLLFERAYKSLRLTEAGRLFAEFYRRQREDLTLITQRAKDAQRKKSTPLRVGCGCGWTLADFLPGILKKLAATHPWIEVRLESRGFSELTAALIEGEADLIFCLSANIHTLPTLAVHRLTETPRVLLYADCHPLAKLERPAPADFQNEVFLVPAPDETAFMIDLVKSFCKPYGFVPRLRLVKSIDTLLLNVLNALGVAIVDEWTMMMKPPGYRCIPLDSSHAIDIAWHRDNENPALPVFLHELAAVFYPSGGCPFDPACPA